MPTRPMTPAITADEARKLVAEHVAGKLQVQPYLDQIHDQIREAASRGKTSIEDPCTEALLILAAEKELEEIVAVLIGEGYDVAWVLEPPPVLVISW
jgi:thymidylate kinase